MDALPTGRFEFVVLSRSALVLHEIPRYAHDNNASSGRLGGLPVCLFGQSVGPDYGSWI